MRIKKKTTGAVDKERRVQASVWLPALLVKRLKIAAAERGTTATALVNEALESFLSNRSAA
ncbi:MAG TPA: hypothetical protein VJJ46_09690 [Anaerolineales bacterium]|nr:hypothetical protein [Anaerolineales bacterium]